VNLLGREIGRSHPFFLIAGPCVIESRQAVLEVAAALREICDRLDILLIFKSSFDKANRTASESYRGPGLSEGLEILSEVRSSSGLPLLTDVHSVDQVSAVASVVDILQTPAF
jgi:2-dehydro-3-deoxyphosphooctonate aldolase (KDO 8-P synthase)